MKLRDAESSIALPIAVWRYVTSFPSRVHVERVLMPSAVSGLIDPAIRSAIHTLPEPVSAPTEIAARFPSGEIEIPPYTLVGAFTRNSSFVPFTHTGRDWLDEPPGT